jgi:hypothetical protein
MRMLIVFLLLSCGGLEGEQVDYDTVKESPYILRTPVYGIRVEVDFPGDILRELDEEAEEFLECLFGDPGLGFEEVIVFRGGREISVPPLSRLRVFVTLTQFECINADAVCGGEYSTGRDLMIVTKSLERFGHELGHRYGMEGDHSDIDEFRECF